MRDEHYFEVCGDKKSMKEFLDAMDKNLTLNHDEFWKYNATDPYEVWGNGKPPTGVTVEGININWTGWSWAGCWPETNYIENLSRHFAKLDFVLISVRDVANCNCMYFKNGGCVHSIHFNSAIMNFFSAVGEAYSLSNDPTKFERIQAILDRDVYSYVPGFEKYALEFILDENFGFDEVLEMNELFLLNRILKNTNSKFIKTLNTEQKNRAKSIKKVIKIISKYKGDLNGIYPLEWE